MSSADGTSSGGGFLSKIVITLLLALALALYLKIVTDKQGGSTTPLAANESTSEPASIQVVETDEPTPAAADSVAAEPAPTEPAPLPEDQLALIKRVFDPK